MSVWLFGANFYPLWAKSGAKLHSNAPASYPLCWHCGILPLMGGGWVTQCAVFAPSLPRPKYGGMQVWCKYGASMTQVWCRALAGADRMDRGIMQTCPVLPVPCITAMQCCIVHCCIALRFGELPHPSTRSHWSTQLCLELHSAQPLCCLHYWMKVMICVLKYVVFMDFFNEHF